MSGNHSVKRPVVACVTVYVAMIYQQHGNTSSGHYSQQAGSVTGQHDLTAHYGDYYRLLPTVI